MRTRGLPDDHVGAVRVVTIDGLEVNMCCGTHVSNLAHLQVFLPATAADISQFNVVMITCILICFIGGIVLSFKIMLYSINSIYMLFLGYGGPWGPASVKIWYQGVFLA